MLFDLETIGVNQIIIWWLVLEKKSKWKRRQIWNKVVVMLLQLYHLFFFKMKIFKTFCFFLKLEIFKTFSSEQWKRGKNNKTETEGNKNYIHSQTQDNPGFIDDTNFADVDLIDGGRASASQSPMSRYITNVTARWGHWI